MQSESEEAEARAACVVGEAERFAQGVLGLGWEV